VRTKQTLKNILIISIDVDFQDQPRHDHGSTNIFGLHKVQHAECPMRLESDLFVEYRLL
jgi:hypothetical protein